MTPLERFIAVVNHKEPDRVPAAPWLGSDFFAGYYKIGVGDWYQNKEFQLKAMLEFFPRFPDTIYYPGLRPSYGPTAQLSAFGCEVVWPHGSAPWVKPVIKKVPLDIRKLQVPDPEKDGLLPRVLEYYRYFAENLPKYGYEVTSGYCIGPFDVACLARGLTQLMGDLYINPEEVHELLTITTESCIQWIEAQYEAAGNTMKHIFITDDQGGLLSRRHWMEFSMPYLKKVASSMPKGVIPLLHDCGNVSHQIDLFHHAGMKMVNLGPEMDIAKAKEIAGMKICLVGNLNPLGVLLKGTPKEVEETCKELIFKAGPGGGFILSTGGGTNIGTPLENIEAMVRAAEKYGRYPLKA
jgi:uroporphyrinogen decarboxylase